MDWSILVNSVLGTKKIGVRLLNGWLNRVKANQYKFVSEQNSTYDRIYKMITQNPNGQIVTVYSDMFIENCVKYANGMFRYTS